MNKVLIGLLILLLVGCNQIEKIDCDADPNQLYCKCDKSQNQEIVYEIYQDYLSIKEECDKTLLNNSWNIQQNTSLEDYRLGIQWCDYRMVDANQKIHEYGVSDTCLEAHEMNESEKRDIDNYINTQPSMTLSVRDVEVEK